jgi:flagellar biogenesis protein FliO
VVTAAKVGTKADVVVVSIGGRRLLLGVTEAQVSRLAWLDGEPDPEEFEGLEPYVPMKPAVAAAPRSPVAAPSATRVASRERSAPGTRGFRDALRTALGRSSSVEDPAVAIAAATEDVVLRSPPARVAAPAGAPEMVDVEGQARGLVLRLQKRG